MTNVAHALCSVSVDVCVDSKKAQEKKLNKKFPKYKKGKSLSQSQHRHSKLHLNKTVMNTPTSLSSSSSSQSASPITRTLLSPDATAVPLSPRPRLADRSAVGHPSVVLYPGWFNPPTFRHVEVVRRLKEVFDQVVVVPLSHSRDWTSDRGDYGELGVVHEDGSQCSGCSSPVPSFCVDGGSNSPSPSGGVSSLNNSNSNSNSNASSLRESEAARRSALRRRLVNYIPTPHRASLVDLAFGAMPGVSVDLTDLEFVENDNSYGSGCSSSCCCGERTETEEEEEEEEEEAHPYMNIVQRYYQATPGIEVWNAFGQEVLLNPEMRALFDAQWDTLTREEERRRFIVFKAPQLFRCRSSNKNEDDNNSKEEKEGKEGVQLSHTTDADADAAGSKGHDCGEAVYMFLDHPCGRGGVRSRAVRDMVYRNEDISKYVPRAVLECIMSRALYRGVPPQNSIPIALGRPRALFYVDERNPAACEAKALLAPDLEDRVAPTVIIVIGGDGTMIRAIRSLWRMRLPFFGINCGHLGFLLNELEEAKRFLLSHVPTRSPKSAEEAAASDDSKGKRKSSEWDSVVHHLPLLKVEYEDMQGRCLSETCFNDAWIERASGQSAWTQVSINGEVRIPKVTSDGLLISTAAGSTAYAQAMGCCPIPVGTPLMCLAGSNVATPVGWRPAYLPLDCNVTFEALNLEKRPVKGFVDGVELGPIRKMRISTSNVGECSLIFLKTNTMLNKLLNLQFPSSLSS